MVSVVDAYSPEPREDERSIGNMRETLERGEERMEERNNQAFKF